MVSKNYRSDINNSGSILHILRCLCAFGSMPSKCQQENLGQNLRGVAVKNIENAWEIASVYVSIILSIYVLGLLVLLLHHVKQKHGQVM